MKRALIVLIAGTILSGIAAAYAATIQRPAEGGEPTASRQSDKPRTAAD